MGTAKYIKNSLSYGDVTNYRKLALTNETSSLIPPAGTVVGRDGEGGGGGGAKEHELSCFDPENGY